MKMHRRKRQTRPPGRRAFDLAHTEANKNLPLTTLNVGTSPKPGPSHTGRRPLCHHDLHWNTFVDKRLHSSCPPAPNDTQNGNARTMFVVSVLLTSSICQLWKWVTQAVQHNVLHRKLSWMALLSAGLVPNEWFSTLRRQFLTEGS